VSGCVSSPQDRSPCRRMLSGCRATMPTSASGCSTSSPRCITHPPFGFMEGSQEFARRSAKEGCQRPQSAIVMKSRPRFSGVGFDRRSLAVASGACGRKVVKVQILSSAPPFNSTTYPTATDSPLRHRRERRFATRLPLFRPRCRVSRPRGAARAAACSDTWWWSLGSHGRVAC